MACGISPTLLLDSKVIDDPIPSTASSAMRRRYARSRVRERSVEALVGAGEQMARISPSYGVGGSSRLGTSVVVFEVLASSKDPVATNRNRIRSPPTRCAEASARLERCARRGQSSRWL